MILHSFSSGMRCVWSALSWSTTIDPKIVFVVIMNNFITFACLLQRLGIQFAIPLKKAAKNSVDSSELTSIYIEFVSS